MPKTSTIRIYCQEPLRRPHEGGLRVGVIADGNGRRGAAGYAAGARNVVRCAERCRDRGDVGLFAALLLSPENVRKRKDAFFARMHALFASLTADVLRGRALAGIRCELHGSLEGLLRRGGAARRLAHAIDLLLSAGDAANPSVRFVLGIDYDEEVASSLHLDLLLRTGMESPDVLRLSGLRPHPSTASVATTKLWCEFGPRDLDDAIEAAKARPAAGFAPGYDAPFVSRFVRALLRDDIAAPLRVVLPVAAPHTALVAALDRLEHGPLAGQDRLAVEVASREGQRRFGPSGPARQSVLLLSPSQRTLLESEAPFTALLAQADASSLFCLADLPLGYASVHRCDATPEGLVEGLGRALRFHVDHPQLHGADRGQPSSSNEGVADAWPPAVEDLVRLVAEMPNCSGPLADARGSAGLAGWAGALPGPLADARGSVLGTSAEAVARDLFGHDAGDDHQRVADVFVAQELASATARGVLSPAPHWKRAALNYCYTGFAIPYRVPEHRNPTGLDWEPLARHVTRFMMAVAASDEEITDRVFPGETDGERRARLAASGRFLAGALRGAKGTPPPVHGSALLATLGAQFEETHARFSKTSAPSILEGFCRASEGLLQANVNELTPEVTHNPLVSRLRSARARADLEQRYCQKAPDGVGDRLRALLAEHESGRDAGEAIRMIRLLCYLIDVAPGIGAGATFRAAALWAPSEVVTGAMSDALDRAATLVDYRFRLANDLSDLAAAANRDRDAKENAWTILLPRGAAGRAREAALVRAMITCDGAASWLDRELGSALGALGALWPSMAAMMRRGIHVGSRFYSMGHFADLSRRDVGAILDALEAPPVVALAGAPAALTTQAA